MPLPLGDTVSLRLGKGSGIVSKQIHAMPQNFGKRLPTLFIFLKTEKVLFSLFPKADPKEDRHFPKTWLQSYIPTVPTFQTSRILLKLHFSIIYH
jgi:hypothetical protein